ncbi:Uncharacterised protein [Mycobacteroides abscessus subsp. abscessus]|nr:Uncharacterised protein [Mycobacteroides abscessus subsp. abscessus]
MLAACLGNLDGDRQIQAQARYVGERVRGVDGQRSEHGEDLVIEIRGKITALVFRQVSPGDHKDPVFCELGAHRLTEYPSMLDRNLLRALTDQFQLFARG